MAAEWRKAQACNLCAFHTEIDTVNGLKDSEFILRLIKAGVPRKLGDHGPLALRLEHPGRGDGGSSPNKTMFSAMAQADGTRAENGLAEVIAPAPAT
jgi:hypothetical protein